MSGTCALCATLLGRLKTRTIALTIHKCMHDMHWSFTSHVYSYPRSYERPQIRPKVFHREPHQGLHEQMHSLSTKTTCTTQYAIPKNISLEPCLALILLCVCPKKTLVNESVNPTAQKFVAKKISQFFECV